MHAHNSVTLDGAFNTYMRSFDQMLRKEDPWLAHNGSFYRRAGNCELSFDAFSIFVLVLCMYRSRFIVNITTSQLKMFLFMHLFKK